MVEAADFADNRSGQIAARRELVIISRYLQFSLFGLAIFGSRISCDRLGIRAQNLLTMARTRTAVGSRTSGGPQNSSLSSDPNDDSLCIICTEKIDFAAILPCNHTTCHRCSLRQRALYGRNLCLVCRTDNKETIFSEHITREYESFAEKDIVGHTDYGIKFTSKAAEANTLRLLGYACPLECSELLPLFKALADHVKNVHNKHYCLICSKHKKAFASELPTYTHKQLQRHQAEGDGRGFTGHPECKYCRGNRFYSEDELNVHIRDKHERCYLCDQHHPKEASYYKNYDSLYEHFRLRHYVCLVPSCVEKRFVVFNEDLDLTAHMLKEHGGLTNGSRFVIGATGLHFQSQLSTFQPPQEPQENPDLKKKRLDERVKHYLKNDTSQIQEFKRLCANFRSQNTTALQLLDSFSNLFKEQQKNEVGLILYELAQLFPKNSEKHTRLMATYNLAVQDNVDQFPVLSGLKNAFTGSLHGWNSPHLANGSQEKFPVLSKPKKSTTTVTNLPIRYTIKKPTKVVSQTATPSNYRPTYLDDRRSQSSTSLAAANSSTLTRHSVSSLNLPDGRFPALEKKTLKKAIPRVNPAKIIDGSTWGPALGARPEPVEGAGIEILDKRKMKLKKKQDKILFSSK